MEPRGSHQPLTCPRPMRQTNLRFLPSLLKAEPGQGRVGPCCGAAPLDGLEDPLLTGGTEVLPHDGVEHDRGRAAPRGQIDLQPSARVLSVDGRRYDARRSKGTPEVVDPRSLVRPNEREQGESPVLRRGVHRDRVAPASVKNFNPCLERKSPLDQEVAEANRRPRISPRTVRSGVEILVPQKIQACARSDLQQPERQARLRRHRQEPPQERARTTHLVGLHRIHHQGSEGHRVLFDSGLEGLPSPRTGPPARRRVVASQLGGPTFEYQPMNRTHESER
jgi:hypothetical protein